MITDSSLDTIDSPLPSPSPIRYFDSVPHELIRSIFEFIFPYSLYPEHYRYRQRTFQSLSLVSKRFLELAEPYLFEVTQARPGHDDSAYCRRSHPDRDFARIVRNISKLELHTRILVLEWLKPDRPNLEALRAIARSDHSVNTLRYHSDFLLDMEQKGNPDWSSFSCLRPFLGSNIVRLHLSVVAVPGDTVFRFPLLQQLVLDRVPFPSQGHFKFKLPRLLHLADKGVYQDPGRQKRLAFISRLAPQLLSLSAMLTTNQELPRSALDSTTLTILFNASIDVAGWAPELLKHQKSIRFLRLTASRDFGADDHCSRSRQRGLSDWVDALEELDHPLQLKTVCLPDRLNVMKWRLKCPRIEPFSIRLYRFCLHNKIRVIWEVDEAHDLVYSQEFVRRVEFANREGGTLGRLLC